MTAMLIGVGSYFSAGVLSLVFSRFRYKLSILGWIGGTYALISEIIFLKESGAGVRSLGAWKGLGIEITIDQTTVLFSTLVVVLNIFTLLYLGKRKKGTFFCLYNLLLGVAFSIAFSHDLFNLYVTIELMSLISISLIGYERKGYQFYAGLKYLVLSSLSMSMYLIGLAIIYNSVGYLGISKLAEAMSPEPGFSILLASTLMVGGLAVKGGIILFSMWLPDAHSYSETVVSTLLSGMAIKCGLIGIIRLSKIAYLGPSLLWLGATTGIIGAILAILENKSKRILAYSTMSQTGYVLLGVGGGTPLGITAASLHILLHGMFKGLLFLSVGNAGVGGSSVFDLKGKKIPVSSKIGLIAGSLSIMAIPPFSGYFSKNLILEGSERLWIGPVILAIGLGTALYFLKLDWRLLSADSTTGSRRKRFSLLLFSFTTGISGMAAFYIFDRETVFGLFKEVHILESIGLLITGALIYWLFKKALRKTKVPYLPFDIDNALIFFVTGILIIAATLIPA